MTLGDVVKNTPRRMQTSAGIALPILEKESVDYHVDKILEDYKPIREAVERQPYLRSVLNSYVQGTMDEYKWNLYGAKTIDSIDKIAAVAELGAGLFGPEAEMAVKAVAEPLEWALKIPFAGYYTAKTSDWFAPVYFTAAEAASLVPYVGEIVDIKHVYLNRVRKTMRKQAAQSFIDNIVNKQVAFA